LASLVIDVHRESDARIRGATRSAAWGRAAVAIVSPLTEQVTMLDRVGGFRYSKSLHLPDVAPQTVVADRSRNSLWVGGVSGILVRLSNDRLQDRKSVV
jgi:hypothetical protein